MQFIPVMVKLNFQFKVFSVTWSFRQKSSWFVAHETFLIIIKVRNSCAA